MARGISLMDQAAYVNKEANAAQMGALQLQNAREMAQEKLDRAGRAGSAKLGSTIGSIAGAALTGGNPLGSMIGSVAGGLIGGAF